MSVPWEGGGDWILACFFKSLHSVSSVTHKLSIVQKKWNKQMFVQNHVFFRVYGYVLSANNTAYELYTKLNREVLHLNSHLPNDLTPFGNFNMLFRSGPPINTQQFGNTAYSRWRVFLGFVDLITKAHSYLLPLRLFHLSVSYWSTLMFFPKQLSSIYGCTIYLNFTTANPPSANDLAKDDVKLRVRVTYMNYLPFE